MFTTLEMSAGRSRRSARREISGFSRPDCVLANASADAQDSHDLHGISVYTTSG